MAAEHQLTASQDDDQLALEEIDLQALAEKITALLLRELAIEMERSGR